MLCFVLFLFVNLNLAVHCNLYTNNNYNIQITLKPVLQKWRGIEKVPKIFKVLRHNKFNIKLIDYDATNATCRSSEKNYKFPSVFEVDDGNSVIKFSEPTKDMTGKWVCIIETRGSVLKLEFKVRVVGDTKEVDIQIAGKTVDTRVSDSPELGYDELGDYYFKDGETVQLICHNINDIKHGVIYLRYYDPLGTILIETEQFSHKHSAFFQRTMKPEDNNHAIDCTYVTSDSNLMFPYRVVFKLTNDSIFDNFTISINDLKMRPTETKLIDDKQVTYYQFTYIQNQILTVSFKATHEEYNSIQFTAEYNKIHMCNSFIEINKTLEYTVQLNTKCINGTYCKLRVLKKDATKSFTIVEILLKNSEFPELRISGLTTKDVIDQYRKNSTTWVIDYWYTVGQPLSLSCFARDKRDLRWILGTSVVAKANGKNISYNFTLSDEYNERLIICEDVRTKKNTEKNRRTIIKLHRKSTYSVPTDDPEKGESKSDSDNTILIACAMVASILAVAMLGFIFYCCKYRTAKSSQTTTNILTNVNHYSSTPIARNSEQISPQGYMVRNSLYEAKSIDNDAAVYQYINVQDIEKEEYANTHAVYPQADKLYANRFAESQPNDGFRVTAEVELNPRYVNSAKREENPQSSDDTETYNYSYSYNVKTA